MEIKCPKCRFRFEENIADFINEASCVCPRCGTPFVYIREVTCEKANTLDKQKEDNGSANDNKNYDFLNVKSSQKENYENKNAELHTAQIQPIYTKWQTTGLKTDIQKKCLNDKNLLLIISAVITFTMIAVIIITIIFSCHKEDVLPIDSYNDNSYMPYTQADTGNAIEDNGGQAPEWIQGRWMFHAEFYDIIIDIDGNKIIERENGHVSKGIFTYKKGKLICKFADNSVFIYRLDFMNQAIDCGDGLIMQKQK